jgi:hypothetical protein
MSDVERLIEDMRHAIGRYGPEVSLLCKEAAALLRSQADALAASQAEAKRLREAFIAWWCEHHDDSRFFNEAVRTCPRLAEETLVALTALKETQ